MEVDLSSPAHNVVEYIRTPVGGAPTGLEGRYVGQVNAAGQREGKGTFVYDVFRTQKSDGPHTISKTYVGRWINDVYWGFGTETITDISLHPQTQTAILNVRSYAGEWKDNAQHGWGTMTLVSPGQHRPQTATVTGNWDDNDLTGPGTWIGSRGEVYNGSFDDFNYNGYGVLTYPESDPEKVSYSGTWELSKKHGEGKMLYKDGTTAVGTYIQDKRHGEFRFYNADGTPVVSLIDGKPKREFWAHGAPVTPYAVAQETKRLEERIQTRRMHAQLDDVKRVVGMPMEDVESATQCPVCFNSFDHEHIKTISECGHALCKPCFDTMKSNATQQRAAVCPTCRTPLHEFRRLPAPGGGGGGRSSANFSIFIQ
jgi:hypothetical protein